MLVLAPAYRYSMKDLMGTTGEVADLQNQLNSLPFKVNRLPSAIKCKKTIMESVFWLIHTGQEKMVAHTNIVA